MRNLLRCEHLRMVTILVLSIAQWTNLAAGKPVPGTKSPENETVKNQNHQIDDANEVHHDADVGIEKNQELVMDVLPDQNNDAAGDGVLDVNEQQQKPDVDPGLENEHNLKKMVFDLEKANKNEKIPIEKLVPADHLDVVKMEQDGHMNKEYHKEMFLGGQHDEFNSDTIDQAQVKLKELVAKADLNKDGYLSKAEMEKWILMKMTEHFEEAERENELIFKHLDPDDDGFIEWKKYYVHFLLSRGFDAQSAWQHIKDYDDSIKLDQDDKDALVSYKFRWTDADSKPTDNKLSKEEFMVFRHPEHSKRSLETMANNVMRGIDANGDGVITEEEFSALPPGEVEGKEFEEMDKKWQQERKTEFQEIVDQNHDGKVDLAELKSYLDPTNPVQARVEAETLMSLMDDDKNNLLSMPEIMKHSDLFISSKLVNYAANVHDEF